MENTSNLSERTFQGLLWRIIGAVRRRAKAASNPRSTVLHGTIAVTMVPLSQLADEWLGSLSGHLADFGEEQVGDVCTYHYEVKLDPGGENVPLFDDVIRAETEMDLDEEAFLKLIVEVSSTSISDGDQNQCALSGTMEAQQYFDIFGDRMKFDPLTHVTGTDHYLDQIHYCD